MELDLADFDIPEWDEVEDALQQQNPFAQNDVGLFDLDEAIAARNEAIAARDVQEAQNAQEASRARARESVLSQAIPSYLRSIGLKQPANPSGSMQREINLMVRELQEEEGEEEEECEPATGKQVLPQQIEDIAGETYDTVYRIIDRVIVDPIHQFNAAVQYEPDRSPGERTVNNVITYRLNACLDTTYTRQEYQGRFHTITLVHVNNVPNEQQEMLVEEGEIIDSLRYTTCVFFKLLTIAGTMFGSLELAVQNRTHNAFNNAVSEGLHLIISHINTGAFAGYDFDLIKTRFDRFYLRLASTKGRLAMGDDRFRAAHFFQIYVGPYAIEHLDGESEGDELAAFFQRVQEDYLAEVNRRIALLPHYEDDVSDLPDVEDLHVDAKTLRRVEKMTINLLPRTIFCIAQQPDVTQFANILLPNDEVQLPPIVHTTGDQMRTWKPDVSSLTLDEGEADAVGCLVNKKDRIEAALLRLSYIWAPPNNLHNNCFLDCLKESDPRVDVNAMREALGHGEHLTMDNIQEIANQRNEVYYFYDMVDTPYHALSIQLQMDPERSRISRMFQQSVTIIPTGDARIERQHHHFLKHHQHCYLIKNLTALLRKVKCSTCSQWINRESFKQHIDKCHYCKDCRKPYHTETHQCTPSDRRLKPNEIAQRTLSLSKETNEDWIPMRPVKKGKKITSDVKLWFADIEAFPDENQEFKPYAVGLLCLSDLKDARKVEIFYGEDCMEKFFERLATIHGTLYYFNGSAFDNFIHIRAMVNHSIYIDSSAFVKNGGRIFSFKHHSKLKVHDLYLFIKSSLKQACKDWGVPQDLSKKDFEHEKVFDFDSAELHREEVTQYLTFDVISLAHLFTIYHKAMWECFSMDMNLVISPAQFAIQAWSANNPYLHEIFIPHCGKEEADDRAAYYGGRVTCQQKQYRSEDWMEGAMKMDYDCIEDYLILGDVNSLYPAAQMYNTFAHGKWKYVTEELDERMGELNQFVQGADDDRLLRCVFLCDVECPKDLLTAFLLERDSKV
jgi:hypothetical protein